MNLKITTVSLVSLAAALFSGCVTAKATRPVAMAVTESSGIVNKSASSVGISVTGGKKTNPAWTSQISDEDFASALRSSIETTGVFSKVLGAEAADYLIEVALVRLNQPMMGLTMTVTVEANWTLKRRSDGSVVWQKAIAASHTAKTSDAFVGVTRLRLATEGAVKENITQALRAISENALN